MDSTAPSNQPAGDGNYTGVSYFQKTICLQDWWLIKVDTNGEGERLGVAGFTSREQHALRLFSSAPISKLYSMCTLETLDGICVILNGLINKSRTLENGFTSEVFTHFVMGFPPYWEHYAEGYFRRGSAADVGSSEDAGRSNLSRGSPENSSKAIGELMHIDSENWNTGAEDCVDMIPEPNFNTDLGLNSTDLRNSQNLVDVVIVDEKIIESSPPETSVFNSEKDPASVSYDKVNSLGTDDSSLPNFAAGVTEKDPLPVAEDSRSLDLSGNLLAVDGSSLPSAGEIINNTENSPIVENPQTCVDDSTTQHQVLSELERNERNNCEFENLRGSQNGSDSPCCGAKMRKIRTRSSAKNDCFGNPEKEDWKDKSLNKPVDLDKAAVYSAGRILTRQLSKSNGKQASQKASEVNDYERNKLNNLSANQDAASNLDSKSRQHKGGKSKKENKAGRSTSKPVVSDRKDGSKNAVKRKESADKDVRASGKITKRKLTYGTPVKQGMEEGVSVVSIESLSCKRSRSGRLLFPSLEFWRNQTLVYDADGQIAGIKEVPSTVQPSRGSKSEPPKKKSKRLA